MASLDLSFDVLSPEHFIWSHSLQFVHCIDVADSFLVHTGQRYIGPGLVSIPAIISKSWIRLAGDAFTFVGLIKNP